MSSWFGLELLYKYLGRGDGRVVVGAVAAAAVRAEDRDAQRVELGSSDQGWVSS